MLTYIFDQASGKSLYEQLYGYIKQDILRSTLRAGEKLPSKRALAKNLGISSITVEHAYAQLIQEGYLYAIEKKGYFVSETESAALPCKKNRLPAEPFSLPVHKNEFPVFFADFKNNSVNHEYFPFSQWSKIMRELLSGRSTDLLQSAPSNGIPELRHAIAGHLYHFRGIAVDPEQLVLGAGTEYLYGLLVQLLGRRRVCAVENPGYPKVARIFTSNGIACVPAAIDHAGMSVAALRRSGADLVHISPAHHFPTGIVMPVRRRQEFLIWASEAPSRYIIEDDYDCEFRLIGKPIQTLQSTDMEEKVIYMNTFSKTLAPSFRISYMILPPHLAVRCRQQLSFYACTVPTLEQYALAEFIRRGYYERHINRMRKYYRMMRDQIIQKVKSSPLSDITRIREENAGLHFLLQILHPVSEDRLLVENAKKKGIRISCLSEYYQNPDDCALQAIVLNYSGVRAECVPEAVDRLSAAIFPGSCPTS